MNEQRLSWDDLRLVLAVAQAGSLAGAARRLGISHATVFRRLAAIEAELGVKLFERTRAGYAPTPAGEDAAAAAERIQDEVHGVERRVAGRDVRPSGTVRVTTTDTLLSGLLSPVFPRSGMPARRSRWKCPCRTRSSICRSARPMSRSARRRRRLRC